MSRPGRRAVALTLMLYWGITSALALRMHIAPDRAQCPRANWRLVLVLLPSCPHFPHNSRHIEWQFLDGFLTAPSKSHPSRASIFSNVSGQVRPFPTIRPSSKSYLAAASTRRASRRVLALAFSGWVGFRWRPEGVNPILGGLSTRD